VVWFRKYPRTRSGDFWIGSIDLDEACAAGADRAELLTTLLRRGDESRARQLAQQEDFRIGGCPFHLWPAIDFATPDFGQGRAMGGLVRDRWYPLSRDAGVAPAPWWQWRTPWTRSNTSRALRGELTVDGA
jgi:hypothetical protein